MNGEYEILTMWIGLGVCIAVIFTILAPFLIWKNTANTTVLLTHILEEQERTNDLLAALLESQGKNKTPENKISAEPARPAPGFTLEED